MSTILLFLTGASISLTAAWLGYMFGLQTQELRMLRPTQVDDPPSMYIPPYRRSTRR